VPLLVGLHGDRAGIRNLEVARGRRAEEVLRLGGELRQRVFAWDGEYRDFARLKELLKKPQREFGEMALCGA